MEIAYINDEHAIAWPEAMEDVSPYDVKQVVSELLSIRTAKDVLDFILKTPPLFFSNISYRSHDDWIAVLDFCSDRESDRRFRGSVVDVVEKDYPEIEVLDGFVVQSGDLGPYIENYRLPEVCSRGPVYRDVVSPPKPHYMLDIGTLESLAFNLQAIARVGAIANGASSPNGLEKVSMGCDVNAQVIDSGLPADIYFGVRPTQDPDFRTYFTLEEVASLEADLNKCDGIRQGNHSHSYFSEDGGTLFIYPSGMSEQEMATNIFLSVMNNLFEEDVDPMFLGYIFKVEKTCEGFKIVESLSPLCDVYRQCARFVAEDNFRLCAFCGRPVLVDKSRGNEAMYCSRTCNTKASVRRREETYALAASDVSIEEIIERIGSRYEQSIRRWYKEARALLA